MKNTIVQIDIVCSYLSKRCSTLMSVRSKNDALIGLHGIGTTIGAASRES
jgi:hypothetical protein